VKKAKRYEEDMENEAL